MRAFRLSLDNALLFYELCHDLKADTEEKRLVIMNELVQLGKVEQITDTPKTKEEYIKHLSQHFSVLNVEPKGSMGSVTSHDLPKGELNG